MKTSCVIIDDEPNALKLLEDYISKTASLELKGQFNNGAEALAFLQERHVDVIFTDINMPGMSGLELANSLPPDQKFIFITGHEKFALHSFDYRVIDYLLKPVSYARFLQAAAKTGSGSQEQAVNVHTVINHLFARSGRQMVRINFEDILYIKGEKEYVSLHFNDKRLLIYKRMKEMESLLPSNFMRVHISYIINIDHLVRVTAKHVITGTEKIPMSSSYRNQIQRYIDLQTF